MRLASPALFRLPMVCANLRVIVVIDPIDDLGALRKRAIARFAAFCIDDDYDYNQLLHDSSSR